MSKKEISSTKQTKEDVNLKGTLIMVMILGIIILVFWFGVYGLFLSR
ncbi:cytochrome c oxidase subunit 2A [Sporosarcina sp. GW1-11]|nr:cytochrome c oxidase subunit 2A [Sporosarcina sp. GW1-11]MDV6377032.1 cytochrome c oxidase subunit 2A [Sporosarcina sp. GW1-11]